MKYNKLVRDKIPEIISRDGKIPVARMLTDDEYRYYLKKKLKEEAAEFNESETLDELADIMEVVLAMCNAYGYSSIALDMARYRKRRERGGFSKKLLLERVYDKKRRMYVE